MKSKVVPTNSFADFYSQFYFDNSIDPRIKTIIGIPSDLGTISKEAEAWITNKRLKKGIFDNYSLAWKSGKVFWQNNTLCLKDSFISDGTYRNGYGSPINIQDFENYCNTLNCISQSDWKNLTFEDLYSSIVKSSPINLGPVYICTSIFFKTKGNLPIYDQFAHKAIRALICEMKPSDIYIGSNPGKTEINKVVTMYNEYYQLVGKLQFDDAFRTEFGDLSKRNTEFISRKFDQALWVYGHCFNSWFDIPFKLSLAIDNLTEENEDLRSQLEELNKAFW